VNLLQKEVTKLADIDFASPLAPRVSPSPACLQVPGGRLDRTIKMLNEEDVWGDGVL
jgi:hypothetical protein